MVNDGLAHEYERGVADVLAYLTGEDATVEHNVHLPGFESGQDRQVDVFVRGTIYGASDATMAVDCKRWNKPIDVAHAGVFKGLIEDIRADFGLLVTTRGASEAARRLLSSARGLRVDMLSLEELAGWRPAGTRFVRYRVKQRDADSAGAAMRRAGFRVCSVTLGATADDEVALEGFRHYPRAAGAPDMFGPLGDALRSVGVEPQVIGSGVSIGGGTPRHRWLEVTVEGQPSGLNAMAADEKELAEALDRVWKELWRGRVERAAMDALRPEDWPTPPRMFG